MAAYLGDTDSEDELPNGWEERVHEDNRVYYADHNTESTHWTHPRSGKRKIVPTELPYGWTKRQDSEGTAIFIETATGKETSTDPRLAFATEMKTSLYDFKQRFDASSTAEHVTAGLDLTSKRALVTGANGGIGFETARTLALHGCEVIFACRDKPKTLEAIQTILAEKPLARCEYVCLDLNSLHSVRDCANEVLLRFKTIDMLILNAGVFAMPFKLTEDNYEQTFQVNHLAHFYLTLLLKPALVGRSDVRILVLSSESHRISLVTTSNVTEEYLSPPTSKQYSSFLTYNDSKLCNVLMAWELNRRWSLHGVTCNALHPGNMVSSNISRQSYFYRVLFALVRPFTKSLQQAAATSCWGATAFELKGIGGQYLNNCWLSAASAKGNNVELAVKVWDLSKAMIERIMGPIPTVAVTSGANIVEEDDT